VLGGLHVLHYNGWASEQSIDDLDADLSAARALPGFARPRWVWTLDKRSWP